MPLENREPPNKFLELDMTNMEKARHLATMGIGMDERILRDCHTTALIQTMDEWFVTLPLAETLFSDTLNYAYQSLVGEFLDYCIRNAAIIKLQAPPGHGQNSGLN